MSCRCRLADAPGLLGLGLRLALRRLLRRRPASRRGLVLAVARAACAIGVLTFTPSVPAGTRILPERALVDRLDLHGRLVGLDLGDHVAGLDRVALVLHATWRGCPPSSSARAPASGSVVGIGPLPRHRQSRAGAGINQLMLAQASIQDVGPELRGSGSGVSWAKRAASLTMSRTSLSSRLNSSSSAQPCRRASRFAGARSGRAAPASPGPPPWCGTWPDRTSSGRGSGRSWPRGSPARRPRGRCSTSSSASSCTATTSMPSTCWPGMP